MLAVEAIAELLRRLATRIDNLKLIRDGYNDFEIDVHNEAVSMARNIVLMELMKQE
ncbi:MAG: hypothetical protein ABRQ38_15405 [Candidatus Eremiobacterota bacterium]